MNLGHVSRQVGILLMLLAGAMSTSLPVAWLCGDPASAYLTFGASSGLTLVAGALFWWLGRKASGTLFRREALAIVGVSWLLIGFFGGLPYVFEGALPNFVDAYFETVSGFSTTGSTVLTNIEGLTEALHWWRTMTHWLGGIGIVVIFVAIFPQLGVGGKLLFKTEVPGPITEGLRPKIRETSLALFWIYLAFTLILAGLLYVVGPDEAEALARGRPNAEMDWHNAFAHSFATMGTGGFSTLNDSVAGFDSVAVDLLLTLFMFLAGVNFGLYYVALQSGWRVALRDRELWMYAGVILAATVVVTANIWGSGDPGSAHALKHEGLWPSARYAALPGGVSGDDDGVRDRQLRALPAAGEAGVGVFDVSGWDGGLDGGRDEDVPLFGDVQGDRAAGVAGVPAGAGAGGADQPEGDAGGGGAEHLVILAVGAGDLYAGVAVYGVVGVGRGVGDDERGGDAL